MKNHLISLKIRIREKLNPYFSKYRQKKILGTDFTIISNNCWGGHVYRYFGLPYASPTIGLFFFAEDYIVFLRDLKGFLSSPLTFVSPENSRFPQELCKEEYVGVPIGCLSSNGYTINIIFLHYKSEEEAREKWTRRILRVNYDHLIVKNSYQNGCNDEMVREFSKLPYKNKLFFSHKSFEYPFVYTYKEYLHLDCIPNDTNNFRKYVNLFEIVNRAYLE